VVRAKGKHVKMRSAATMIFPATKISSSQRFRCTENFAGSDNFVIQQVRKPETLVTSKISSPRKLHNFEISASLKTSSPQKLHHPKVFVTAPKFLSPQKLSPTPKVSPPQKLPPPPKSFATSKSFVTPAKAGA
jgi:hypothetical protein